MPGSAPLPWQCSQTIDGVEGDLAPDAGRDLVERRSRPRPGCRRRRAPGAAAEAERAAAAEEGLEDVVDRAEGGAARVEAAGAQALVAVGVVGATPLGVGEDLVGLGRRLELLLGLGVVVVDVGVQFAGEPRNAFLISVSPASRGTPRTS